MLKKHGKIRLHTSDDSSEDELVNMLKRRKKKRQQKEGEKRKGNSENPNNQKGENERNIEPDQMPVDVKEEISERSQQENKKPDEPKKESNASLEAIQRILERKVEVEVVDLESDDDIKEIPPKTPKILVKKGASKKQSIKQVI